MQRKGSSVRALPSGRAPELGEELKDHISARRVSDLREEQENGEEGAEMSAPATPQISAPTKATSSSDAEEEEERQLQQEGFVVVAQATQDEVKCVDPAPIKARPLRLFSTFEMSPETSGERTNTTTTSTTTSKNRGAVSSRPRCAADLEAAISRKRRVNGGNNTNQSFDGPGATITNAGQNQQQNPDETFFETGKNKKEFDLDRFTTNALHKVRGEQVVVEKVPFDYSPEGNPNRKKERREAMEEKKLQEEGATPLGTAVEGNTNSVTQEEQQKAVEAVTTDSRLLTWFWAVFRLPLTVFTLARWKAVQVVNFAVWILVVLRDQVLTPTTATRGSYNKQEGQRRLAKKEEVKDQVAKIQELVSQLQVQVETNEY